MVSHFSFTSFIYLPDMLMNPWVQMALATPVQFIIGGQFYVGAYKALRNKVLTWMFLWHLERRLPISIVYI